jgi:hypothetical protein
MGAEDMTNFRAAEEARARQLARRQAKAEGLRGADRQARMQELLGDTAATRAAAAAQATAEGLSGWRHTRRVNEIIEQSRPEALTAAAADFGRRATYNQQPEGVLGALAEGIGGMTRNVPGLRMLVPFTRIVANVANRTLDWSPWGVKRAYAGQWGGKYSTEAPTGVERRVALVKAVEGTLVLAGLLALALKNRDEEDPWFDVTADGPQNPAWRAQKLAQGWKPYTVKLGDQYWSYRYTPFHAVGAMIGALADANKYQRWDEKELADRISLNLTSMAGVLLNQTYLAGLNDFLQEVTQSRSGAWRTFSRMAAGLVTPSLAREIEKIWNPTVSDATTFGEALTRELPVARQFNNPPRLTVLGEPAVVGRAPIVGRFWSERTDDPVWQGLARRNLYVPAVGGGTKVDGRPSTRAERYYLNQQAGAQIRRVLVERQQWWQREADQAAAQKWLGKVADQAHEDAKRQLEEYYRR